MKHLVQKTLRRLGYEIRAVNQRRGSYTDLITETNPIIFDVGANEGQSLATFRSRFPTGHIHAFEPDPRLFERLRAEFCDPRILINNVGVGASAERKTLHRCKNTGSNSFLQPNVDSKYNLGGALALDGQVQATITTLDEYCATRDIGRIDLLKTDTQGYDLNVLRGAKKLLRNGQINVVKTEILFCDLYYEVAAFLDFEQLLQPFGYRLFTLENVNISFDGRLTHLDAVYARSR